MGYSTRYELVLPDKLDVELVDKIHSYLEDVRDRSFRKALIYKEPCKWYEHENDMVKLSKVFPTVTFELNGSGEESGDIWRKFFYNGDIQRRKAKIEFDPIDEW